MKMKSVNEVHGKFNSFAAMGAAFGVKQKKAAPEKIRKCKVCGGSLTKVAGNVWVCNFHKLEEKELGEEKKPIQVFSECGNVLIENAYA